MQETCTENCFGNKDYNTGCLDPWHSAMAKEGVKGYQLGFKDGRENMSRHLKQVTFICPECNNYYDTPMHELGCQGEKVPEQLLVKILRLEQEARVYRSELFKAEEYARAVEKQRDEANADFERLLKRYKEEHA